MPTGAERKIADEIPGSIQGDLPVNIYTIDLWDHVLRIASSNAAGKASLHELLSRLHSEERAGESPAPRPIRILATEEARPQLKAAEQLDAPVILLPRLLAIYWSLRARVGLAPCLVIETGLDCTRVGLVIDGILTRQLENRSELSLAGIWDRYVGSNEQLRRVVEIYNAKGKGDREGGLVGVLMQVMRTGERSNAGPIPFVPPIDFSHSLEDFRQLLKAADPDGQADRIIVSDWGAAHCNLPGLLERDYKLVLTRKGDEAFTRAVRGLLIYALDEQETHRGRKAEADRPSQAAPDGSPERLYASKQNRELFQIATLASKIVNQMEEGSDTAELMRKQLFPYLHVVSISEKVGAAIDLTMDLSNPDPKSAESEARPEFGAFERSFAALKMYHRNIWLLDLLEETRHDSSIRADVERLEQLLGFGGLRLTFSEERYVT